MRSPPRKIRVRMSNTEDGYVLVSRYEEGAEEVVKPTVETPKAEQQEESELKSDQERAEQQEESELKSDQERAEQQEESEAKKEEKPE